MERSVIYPYDISSLHIPMFSKELSQVEIISAVAPKGWGYDEQDLGYKYGVSTGIIVKSDLKEELGKADSLILVDSIIEVSEEKIQEALNLAKSLNKKVIDMRKYKNNENIEVMHIEKKLKKIQKPVILVIGTGERTGKFDIQLLMRKAFLDTGYKVTQIGSKSNCDFWNIHGYPEFMLSNKLHENEKVLAFNQYVHNLSIHEESDVIIIGVPGGLGIYDDSHTEFFGMQNFYVSNAIMPDYIIMNSSYMDFTKEYIESVVNLAFRKFNYNIDALILSNSYINADATDEQEKIVYTSLKQNFILEEAEKLNLYSIYDEEHRGILSKMVIDTLENYGEVSAI